MMELPERLFITGVLLLVLMNLAALGGYEAQLAGIMSGGTGLVFMVGALIALESGK